MGFLFIYFNETSRTGKHENSFAPSPKFDLESNFTTEVGEADGFLVYCFVFVHIDELILVT